MNLKNLFTAHPFTARTPERQVLTIPIHERISQERWQGEVQTVLTLAASQIAESGLLWRWIRHAGASKLVRWDSEQLVFLQGNLTDWITFFGTHWRVTDTNNQEYLGPSHIVADRLIGAILMHPSTPVASWALQLAKKRKAARKNER